MLSHDQKKYLKKRLKDSSIEQISNSLKIDQKEVLNYLRKRWGQEKLNQFLKKQQKTDIQKKETRPSQNSSFDTGGKLAGIWIYLVILAVLVLGVYANSLDNAFVSDDIAEIRDNPNIGNLSTIATRPLGFIRLVFNWFVYHIAGLNPPAFRLINLALHLGSVFLLFRILIIIYSKRVAFFASILFAIHPGISEAVVWISGGIYPQFTFFYLLALLLYILAKDKKYLYWFSVSVFALTFMSHHAMPLALFLTFPLFEFAFGDLKKNWPKVIPYFLITIINLIYDVSGIQGRVSTLQSVHYQERGIDNIFILVPVAISSYFELIFWPKILTLYHSELAFGGVQFFFRASVTALYFIVLLISFVKSRQIFFWASFFLISLIPTLTPLRLNWVVAERYLYLPSVGIFVLIIIFLDRLAKISKLRLPLYLAFVAIVTLLSLRTVMRNIDWHNEDNLWIATGKTSPSSPNTHNNLGDVYGRWGDKQRALQEFQTAILLKPNYADAYHNLANTYVELNDQEKALENYKIATQFNPILWQSYQNIAAIYFTQKKYDLALENVQKAISINQKNLNLWNNLGIVYLTMGDKNKAKEVFSQVLAQDPKNQLAKQALMETSK